MKNFNLTKQDILYRLGYFRTKKNISAYKLSRNLGHADNYIYRVESGEIQLTIDLLIEILDYLNITTSEFFLADLNTSESNLQ